MSRRAGLLFALVWLLIYVGQAWVGVTREGVTFDEPTHLAAGYARLHSGVTYMDAENGMLAQLWAALPVAPLQPEFPPPLDDQWQPPYEWKLGRALLFDGGNAELPILSRARVMMSVFGAVLGLVIFFWSSALFGWRGGLLSLLLFGFSPDFLTHSLRVTTDVPAALFLTLTTWLGWRLCLKVDTRGIVLAVVACVALFLTKLSAFLMVPIWGVMALIRLWKLPPLEVDIPGFRGEVASRGGQLVVLGGVLAGCGLATFVAIWGVYGFEFLAIPAREVQGRSLPLWGTLLERGASSAGLVNTLLSLKLFPEAWLYGLQHVFTAASKRNAFLMGDYSKTGWWYFFPVSFLVKTPPSVLVILGLAAVTGFRSRKLMTCVSPAERWRTVPLWTQIGVYGGVALLSHLNIGHRHLLPMLPPLMILAGVALKAGSQHTAPRGPLLLTGLALVTLVWDVIPRGHFHSYFSPLVGGPNQGYRYLVDSSLDWGEDLKDGLEFARAQVGKTLDEQVYLSYFGADVLPDEAGIQYLPCFLEQDRCLSVKPLEPGWFIFSATQLQGIYNLSVNGPVWDEAREAKWRLARSELQEVATQPDPWAYLERYPADTWWRLLHLYSDTRVGKLLSVLRSREPDVQISPCWLAYHVDRATLEEILGPQVDTSRLRKPPPSPENGAKP